MKIQIRPHGPNVADSIEKMVAVADATDVLAYLMCTRPDLGVKSDDITQHHFGRDPRTALYDPDQRIWDCWLICVKGKTVLWADGPVPGITLNQNPS